MSAPASVPHLRIIVAVCVLAIVGYAGFSVWVVGWSGDAALRGDVIGTWKSFAVLAFGFWIGSSSAGKSGAAEQQQTLTDLAAATKEMAKSVPNVTEPDVVLEPGETARAAGG